MDKPAQDMVIARARELYRAERAQRSLWRRILDALRGL